MAESSNVGTGRVQRPDWAAKPPRLRSACTECHDAKTRCSGEKTGCQRCLNYALICKYGVSMVGRASKREADHSNSRRARHQSSLSRDRMLSIPAVAASGLGSGSGSSSSSNTSVGVRIDADLAMGGFLGPLVSQLGDDGEPPGSTALSNVPFSSAGLVSQNVHAAMDPTHSFDWPHMFQNGPETPSATLMSFRIDDFALPHDSDTAGSTSSSASITTTQPTTSNTDSVSEENNILPMITDINALCKILEVLETRIHAKKPAIDDLLRVNKECVATILRIVDSESYTRCKCCRALIATALELVVTLYGAATKVLTNSTSAPDTSGIPKLLLGVFHIDREDHVTIFNHVISNEVRKCQQILKNLHPVPSSAVDTLKSPPSQALNLSFQELESRIETLLSTLD